MSLLVAKFYLSSWFTNWYSLISSLRELVLACSSIPTQGQPAAAQDWSTCLPSSVPAGWPLKEVTEKTWLQIHVRSLYTGRFFCKDFSRALTVFEQTPCCCISTLGLDENILVPSRNSLCHYRKLSQTCQTHSKLGDLSANAQRWEKMKKKTKGHL